MKGSLRTVRSFVARGASFARMSGAAALSAIALGGCLQTAPVIVTPQDQAARLIYTCPNGRTLDVTRVQGNTSALLTVDGRTIQLSRDATLSSGERYTNRVQILTLYGNSASYQALGQPLYGPCNMGSAPGVPGADEQQQPRRRGSDGS